MSRQPEEMEISPFVLYSGGRCGSSTLLRILETWKGLSIAHEPFNSAKHNGRYAARTPTELNKSLNRLIAQFHGYKHVYDPTGWPFPKDSDLNLHLLTILPVKVILLNRRNMLQQFVSAYLSQNSRVWENDKPLHRASLRNVAPLDVEHCRRNISRAIEFQKTIVNTLESHRVAYLKVWYEDLFSPDLALEKKMKRVERVFRFIGLPETTTADRHPDLLSYRHKINDAESYRSIPNIREIDRQLGCEGFGRLFD